MHGENNLPAALDPKKIYTDAILQEIIRCASCGKKLRVSEGVTFGGIWTTPSGENGNSEDDEGKVVCCVLVFCSLGCLLESVVGDGNA